MTKGVVCPADVTLRATNSVFQCVEISNSFWVTYARVSTFDPVRQSEQETGNYRSSRSFNNPPEVTIKAVDQTKQASAGVLRTHFPHAYTL